MRDPHIYLLTAALLFSGPLGAQITSAPAKIPAVNSYYSADEYQLAHSMFDRIFTDLRRAQSHADPNNLGDTPRLDIVQKEVQTLEQNWDNGRFDSAQIDNTISAMRMVLNENRFVPYDRDALSADLSRLLDFRSAYY